MALYGDTSADLTRREQGLDHELSADASGIVYGDAHRILGKARGGNDTLTGGAGASNALYGDAHEMYDSAVGGADSLIGGTGAGLNLLYGDAYQMFERSDGGNDTLTGGTDVGFNELYGDAFSMVGAASGGNDILTGGDRSVNFMYGDAAEMSDRASCGDDVLISGTGTDYMYGDADPIYMGSKVKTGTDTFVFKPDSGADIVYDFRQADGDKIDVSAYGFQDFSAIESSISYTDAGTASGIASIDFGGLNIVQLNNFSGQLTADDFIFQTV